MKNFYYKVKTLEGLIKTGYIKALNFEDAAKKLKKNNFTIIQINEQFSPNSKIQNINFISKEKVLSIKEKLEFFNAFSVSFDTTSCS